MSDDGTWWEQTLASVRKGYEDSVFGYDLSPTVGFLLQTIDAQAEQLRELRQAGNDLTDLLITTRVFLDDDEVRAAAYRLRALSRSEGTG